MARNIKRRRPRAAVLVESAKTLIEFDAPLRDLERAARMDTDPVRSRRLAALRRRSGAAKPSDSLRVIHGEIKRIVKGFALHSSVKDKLRQAEHSLDLSVQGIANKSRRRTILGDVKHAIKYLKEMIKIAIGRGERGIAKRVSPFVTQLEMVREQIGSSVVVEQGVNERGPEDDLRAAQRVVAQDPQDRDAQRKLVQAVRRMGARVSFEVVTEKDKEAYEGKRGIWSVPEIRRGWKGYKMKVYRDVYEEDEETGEIDRDDEASGLESEEDEKSLYDILETAAYNFGNFIEWSSSHPAPGDWINSEMETPMYSGDQHTQYGLFIERIDNKPLSEREMAFISRQLALYPRNPRFQNTRKGFILSESKEDRERQHQEDAKLLDLPHRLEEMSGAMRSLFRRIERDPDDKAAWITAAAMAARAGNDFYFETDAFGISPAYKDGTEIDVSVDSKGAYVLTPDGRDRIYLDSEFEKFRKLYPVMPGTVQMESVESVKEGMEEDIGQARRGAITGDPYARARRQAMQRRVGAASSITPMTVFQDLNDIFDETYQLYSSEDSPPWLNNARVSLRRTWIAMRKAAEGEKPLSGEAVRSLKFVARAIGYLRPHKSKKGIAGLLKRVERVRQDINILKDVGA